MQEKTAMRTSQIAMLSAAGGLALVVIVLAGVGRSGMSDARGATRDFGDRVTRQVDRRDFDALEVRGAWEIELEQGDGWRVELSFPENIEDDVIAEIRDGRLVLDWQDSNTGSRWLWFGERPRLSASIVMPELTDIDVAGTGDIEISGFSGERLELEISGAANAVGRDGRYERLELDVGGAGRVDLRRMAFRDADVNLSGASNIEITMDGGVLSGSLSGVGNVRYHGEVASESVNVSGLGRVQRAD
jgi:hypothetical protein